MQTVHDTEANACTARHAGNMQHAEMQEKAIMTQLLLLLYPHCNGKYACFECVGESDASYDAWNARKAVRQQFERQQAEAWRSLAGEQTGGACLACMYCMHTSLLRLARHTPVLPSSSLLSACLLACFPSVPWTVSCRQCSTE